MAEPRRKRNESSTVPARATSSGLRELVHLSPDALLIVNHLGNIVMASEQTAALFGYHLEDLAELPLEALLPEHLRAVHLKHREQYVSAPRSRSMGAGLDLVGRRKDGSEFPVDISLRPVLLGDEQLTIGAIRDVSEQRRAERERAQIVAQLRLQTELVELSHDAILGQPALIVRQRCITHRRFAWSLTPIVTNPRRWLFFQQFGDRVA